MIMLTACLVFAGCMSLALSQDRNWKTVAATAPAGRAQAAARFVGWVLLGATLAISVSVAGPGFAVLMWTLQIAVASFIVAMMLSFRPGSLRPVVRAYSALWP